MVAFPSVSSRLNAELISNGSVTTAEFNYLDGLAAKIQDQLDARVSKAAIIGDVAIMGKITAGSTVGILNGVNAYHAVILKGDSTAFGPAYAITAGDITSFVETGGVWRFRKIAALTDTIMFEINDVGLYYKGALLSFPKSECCMDR